MEMFFVCIGILIVIIDWLYVTYHFQLVHYDLSQQADYDNSLKIVFLSDLHNNSYGERNIRLIQAIQKQKPDIVLIGGDMFVKSPVPDTAITIGLMKELVKIAPVFCANGNHEKKVMEYWEESKDVFLQYKEELEKIGVHYLLDSSEKIKINGRAIEIIGLDLGLEHYRKIWHKPTLTTKELGEKISERSCEEEYRILLAHNPQYFQLYAKMDVNLVVSGHIHGGMIILPFVGGLIAPNLRFFPKYDFGTFVSEQTTMVLSKGLGVHSFQLRLFNIPEVSVIKI